MDDTPTLDAALGRAWREEFAWAFLTRLTEIGSRLGGHPGERRAAALVAEALREAGVDPTIEPFEIERWTRGQASLTVRRSGADPTETADRPTGERVGTTGTSERTFETYALPYSPAGDVRGRLVDIGNGTPEEIEAIESALEGAVAVTSTTTPPGRRYVHRMETFGQALEAGAAGVVFANHVPGQLPPTGSLRFDLEADVPGVGVSKETGAWLREYAEHGFEAILSVEARTEPGTSRNVVGSVGPDSVQEVLVLAHHDAHDVAEGALDNGCGITVAVSATRLLAEIEADLDCRVRVAGVGCEELGLMGAETLADALDLDRVRAVVNVDGAGRFRDLKALTHGSSALEALAIRTVEGAGQPLTVEDAPHPYSDHWPFLRAGVPALQLHSVRPGSTGQWERGWTHTRADTRDKVDPRNLREHAMLTALLVRELTHASEDELERVDPAATRARLRESGAEPGMRAAGIWPERW